VTAATAKGDDPEILYRLGMANYAVGMVNRPSFPSATRSKSRHLSNTPKNAKTFLATAQLYTNPVMADASPP